MSYVPNKIRGFTLVELIGVLSIIAIMASVIAPSVFKDIKRARQDKESLNLAALNFELEQSIYDNKRIPSRTLADWSGAIAAQSSLAQEKIARNEKGFLRGYYVDPRFFTASDVAFPGYTQTTGVGTAPVSPRIILVSLMTNNAPAAPSTSAAFNAIWDQSTSATLTEGPDVKISRLNLRAAFQRLVLTNENTNQPAYQLESGARSSIPAASAGGDGLLTRYVLRNTKVSLYTDPFPAGNLDQVLLADDEKAYAFELVGSVWTWQRP
ncbi:MAG: prepilin-type N-terminal cleavage/methylation domain-containing protein [Gammaproteobacteria bacterium]|jgi:prepilin-type N-terminal cleavage/methylation domain-containing protein